MILNMT